MSDRLEREIQEYLDHRMSDADRDAFEARLRDDQNLARRVRADRELGEALREGVPELSPAFYTRLRGRFEEQAIRDRRWFRLLSWETAGLAAAIALVAVVFVPFVLERGTDTGLPTVAPPTPVLDDAAREAAPAGRDARTDADEGGAPVGLPEQEAPERQIPAPSVAVEPAEAEPTPDGEPSAAKEEDATRRLRGAAQGAVPAAPKSKIEQMQKRESSERLESLDEVAGASSPRSRGALPPGLVAGGDRIEIREREPWNRLAARLDWIGPYRADQRIILVGPGDSPLDCDRAETVLTQGRWEIRFFAPAPGAADAYGCLFVLPDDGRAVGVARPGGAR